MNPFSWVQALHETFITRPLRQLYFNGPSGLGFWDGTSWEDICFSISGTPSSFWVSHMDPCLKMCEQKFFSFGTAVNFIVYSYILIRGVNGLMFHFSFTRPVLRELAHLRTHGPPVSQTSISDTVQKDPRHTCSHERG